MTRENLLEGASALVTGASAGIGRATARSLARDGADVAVAARRVDRLKALAEELADEHDVETLVLPLDVTEQDAVADAVDAAADAFGGLDAVVSNAGVGREGGVEDVDLDAYHHLMNVNVHGTFYVTRACLPHLRASSGTLVFVGSYAGKHPYPGNPVYGASKWWIRGFAHSLAGAVGGDGVAVSVVNPSEVRSEFGSDYRDSSNVERFEAGSYTEPETVADAIAFAVRQDPPDAATELDLYRRDKFETT